MNLNAYSLTNLTMISRLGLLENATRTRSALDSLISILKYMENAHDHMTTLDKEISVVNKMYSLFQTKKGVNFNGILTEVNHDNVIYLPQGILVDFVNVAIQKELNNQYEVMEIKVICEKNDDKISIIIQDNGTVEIDSFGKSIESQYKTLVDLYSQEAIAIDIKIKKGIGTKVIITVVYIKSPES